MRGSEPVPIHWKGILMNWNLISRFFIAINVPQEIVSNNGLRSYYFTEWKQNVLSSTNQVQNNCNSILQNKYVFYKIGK